MLSGAVIRPYRPADRAAVRRLCCETGYLGKAIDPVFEDRELFADYLTKFYTDREPESTFVLEHDGELKGYLMGSRRPFLQQFYNFFHNLSLFARGTFRYPRYNKASKAFVRWILLNAWREVPAAPRRMPHFHFNLLPEVQVIDVARRNGINISNQHSRPVVPQDFEYYDIILAMDNSNKRDLMNISEKHHHHKIKLLLDYLNDSPLKEVPDPYYSGGFDYVFELVSDACSAFIQKEQHIQLK